MPDIERLIESAGIDPRSAPKLLQIASEHLRNGVVLPPSLAKYLARAFDRAAKAPQDEQARKLLESLGIGVVIGRPKKVPEANGVVALSVAVYGDDKAYIGLRSAISKTLGISKNTAKSRIAEAREKLEQAGKELGNIRVRKRTIRHSESVKKGD